MKKLTLCTIVYLLCFSIFCQNTAKSSVQLMDEAKKYEDNQKWIHAMGCYIDVYSCSDYTEEERQTAYNRYSEIEKEIKSGNPGLGKFNAFEKYERWAALFDEFDEYFESHLEMKPEFSKPEKNGIDYETKKINYYISFKLYETERYQLLFDILEDGSGRSSVWENLKGKYKGKKNEWRIKETPETQSILRESKKLGYKIALIISDGENKNSGPNFTFTEVYEDRFSEGNNDFNKNKEKYKEYLSKNCSICIQVDSETSKKIENGTAKIVVTSIKQNTFNLKDDELTQFFKQEENLANLDPLLKETVSQGNKQANVNPIEEIKNSMVTIEELNIQMLKTEVTQELYKAAIEDNPSNSKGDKLPVESVSYEEAISFCNRLSIKSGLVPCYGNKITEYIDLDNGNLISQEEYNKEKEKATKKKKYTPKNYGARIVYQINEQANGYRLPTINDYVFIINKAIEKNQLSALETVGWFKINSEGKTHEVGNKNPLVYDLYDLVGNVWEFTEDMNGLYYCIIGSSFSEGKISSASDLSGGIQDLDGRYMNIGFRLVRRNIK